MGGSKKIYVATWTTYTDDYKHRGRGWSDETPPALFSTRKYAEEYLAELIRSELEEKDIELFEEEYSEYVTQDEDGDSILDISGLEYSELNNILGDHCAGEYVPVTVEWDIETQELDTQRVQKKKRKIK